MTSASTKDMEGVTTTSIADKTAVEIVKPSLPKLLSALALGARSVNALPTSSSSANSDDDNENKSDNEEEDEFLYQMAFPEFNSLCQKSRTNLKSLLYQALDSSCHELTDGLLLHNTSVSKGTEELDTLVNNLEFDNPQLWERAAEACDVLLERVDIYIQNVKEGNVGSNNDALMGDVEQMGNLAKKKAQFGWSHMMSNLVDMEKPQITYNFTETIHNSRTAPFKPQTTTASQMQLQLQPGHGLDTRHYNGENISFNPTPCDAITPKEHYSHPYKEIIETLSFRKEQLGLYPENLVDLVQSQNGRSGTLYNPSFASNRGVWIDHEEDLIQLVNRIQTELKKTGFLEIAIDLEAHSYRSFNGITCLMQLSLRRPNVSKGTIASSTGEEVQQKKNHDKAVEYDFLIDTLALRHVMNQHLAPIFADPNIVKVMHGADSDIPWLQRDFGIYIVNLFDTGRAARLLPNFRPALAYLLLKYANVEADKKHQLSDWRQRPLPDEMRAYAVSDTQYLLDIYDKLRFELLEEEKKNGDISIRAVLDSSQKVSLIRFGVESFKPNGYKKLITSKRGKKKSKQLNKKEEMVLKALYDWRDKTAREEDESLQYVCPDSGLLRITLSTPDSVTTLQRLINPLPPLVLTHASQILQTISNASSQFATSDDREIISPGQTNNNTKRSGMLSPVLGTEALYKEAGWMTPLTKPIAGDSGDLTSSAEDEDCEMIEVHEANKNFDSSQYSSHSLELGSNVASGGGNGGDGEHEQRRGKSVDGLGAARAALNKAKTDLSAQPKTIEMEADIAQNCAKNIRDKMLNENLLGIVRASIQIVDEEKEETTQNNEKVEGSGAIGDAKIDELPKSMQEIYHISYRNRRRTKKPSNTGEKNEETKDVCGLEEAEALLAKSGPNGSDYFQETVGNKRQCTEDAKNASNKDVNIELMTELGWVKNKEEAESLIAKQESNEDGCDEDNLNEQKRNSKVKKHGENDSIRGKQQGNQIKNENKRNSSTGANISESALPAAFSNVRGIYDPNTPKLENPFFSGAAVSGGTLNQTQEKTGRKKSAPNNRRGKRGNGMDRAIKKDNNKTFVYRNGPR